MFVCSCLFVHVCLVFEKEKEKEEMNTFGET